MEERVNYLAHAYQNLNEPYFAAGTALPDWMSVIDRKNRARRQYAEPVTSDPDPEIASFARGVLQHHADDQWFHGSQAFVQLSTTFAVELRQYLGQELGHQAGFVGHISVELLLDAHLIVQHPRLLDDYYGLLTAIDRDKLQVAANKICPKPVIHLPVLIERFVQERFLADYPDDHGLLRRLNGVMRRVQLPPLPDSVVAWLSTARPRVARQAPELLAQVGHSCRE